MLVSPEGYSEAFNDFHVAMKISGGKIDGLKAEITERMKAENKVKYYGLNDVAVGDGAEPTQRAEDLDEKNERAKVTDLAAIAGEATGQFSRAGKVAVIPLVGGMSKNSSFSFWGGYTRGTLQVCADIRAANADPDVTGIVMYVDSPGGTVDGTHLLSEEVRLSAKPIVVVVSGMCCSAAMWAVAYAFKIYTTSPQDYVGSIGVYTMHGDFSKMLEEYGIKYTVITATGSTDKVIGDPYNPLKPEDEEKIRAKLDVVRADFVTVVKRGRAGKIADADKATNTLWTGAVFCSKEAKTLGLTDGTATMEAAILEAHRAGRKAMKDTTSVNNLIQENMAGSLFEAYLKETEEKATEPVTLSPSQANALKSKLDDQGKQLTALNTELEAVKGQVTTLTTERDAAKGQVTTLEAEVTLLKGKAVAAPVATGDVAALQAENATLKLKIEGKPAIEAKAAVVADPSKNIEASEAVAAEAAVEGFEAQVARLTSELAASKLKADTVDALTVEVSALKLFKAEAVTKYNDLADKHNALADKSKQAAKMDAQGKEAAQTAGQSGERLTQAEYERLTQQ